jgi:hypothetical protein
LSDLRELKQHAIVHARTQRVPQSTYQPVLDRIVSDTDSEPGSWAVEWSRAAAEAEQQGLTLDACRLYNLARFPYEDGPARRAAHTRSIAAFDAWRRTIPGIEPLRGDLAGGQVRAWSAGLSATDRKPLLILMGGIVSTKESYAQVLAEADMIGMAGIVTEIPGVGENTLPYDAESWRLLPGLLDAVSDRADVSQTYTIALSFSGHLALRAATEDARIRGIVTTGAPVHDFFADPDWLPRIPRITVDTLAHLTGTTAADLPGYLRDWAITDDQLALLDIPVAYGASLRDEIIPQSEVDRLRRNVRQFEVLTTDDVHGSPEHVNEIRFWTILSLLRQRSVRGPIVDGLVAAVDAARGT